MTHDSPGGVRVVPHATACPHASCSPVRVLGRASGCRRTNFSIVDYRIVVPASGPGGVVVTQAAETKQGELTLDAKKSELTLDGVIDLTTEETQPRGRTRFRSRNARLASSDQVLDLSDDVPTPVVPGYADGVRMQRPRGVYISVVKPVIDRGTGLILLVLLSPIIGLVALAIRIKLGKGVIYRQQRVGRGGMPFTIYKFRTMLPDRRAALDTLGPPDGIDDRRQTHKTENDPRHTPLGRLLRKTSLDELPQLWNVVAGRMSLVGPRPELTSVVLRYEPWQHDRHLVLPGITGLWQVSERTTTAMHEATELDIEYIRRFSPRTDLWILARTAGALRRGGS